jgi:ubiquinone/menaquinone biosynthesis C-methylase UbiE
VGRAAHATLVLADARRLPLADDSADAVFAAGLVSHLPDTGAGLRELARITRPGGLLVLLHPSGRAARSRPGTGVGSVRTSRSLLDRSGGQRGPPDGT